MAGPAGEVKAYVAAALESAGMTVRQVTLGDERANVHADALTLRRAATAAAGAGVVVSVGSGTIADIGKALSADLGRSRTSSSRPRRASTGSPTTSPCCCSTASSTRPRRAGPSGW